MHKTHVVFELVRSARGEGIRKGVDLLVHLRNPGPRPRLPVGPYPSGTVYPAQ